MFLAIRKFIQKLEDSSISFGQFAFAFLAIVFLRNFLESFSDSDNAGTAVSASAYLLHYPVFYLSLFLALAIIVAMTTKEQIVNVSKLLLYFFPVVLIAPLADLLLSGGQGFNMSYIFCDAQTLVRKYFTFSGGYQGSGATPGIQIELTIIFLLTTVYIFLKTKKITPALLGLILFYSAAFFMGALPSLVAIIWNFMHPISTPASDLFSGEVVLFHYYSFNTKMMLTFVAILILESGAWFWIHDRQKCNALLKSLRGFRALHYLCMMILGLFIGYSQNPSAHIFASPFPILIFIAMAASVLFAWWAAVGINDYFDVAGDKVSNPGRPLASGLFQKKEFLLISIIFAGLSLISAAIVRYSFFITILLTHVLSWLYSAPPFRLKRIPVLSTFIIALCAGLVSLGGFVVFSRDYSFNGYPPQILLAIVVSFTLALTFKDIKDVAGDKISGVRTLVTIWGEKRGKQITGMLVILSYFTAIFILDVFILLPLAFVLGGISFYFINRKNYREAPLFYLYFLFLSLVVYFVYPNLVI